MDQPNTNDAEFAEQLAVLRRRFADQLTDTLDELNRLMAGRGPNLPRDLLLQIHLRLHKLVGAGSTFGFPELSVQACALEEMVKGWLEGNKSAPRHQWKIWLEGLQALRASILVQDDLIEFNSVPEPVTSRLAARGVVRVAMVHSDESFSLMMCRGLRQFGYIVSAHQDLRSAQDELLSNPPHIVLMESPSDDGENDSIRNAVASLVGQKGSQAALIYFTRRADFPIHLLAAKMGAEAVFIQPVDVPMVAARIESLVRAREQQPYRVLIVEDDEALAEHYRLVLQAAGMLAERVSQPSAVLIALQALQPDVLLMDLYMPDCTGEELARLIRFDNAWQSLPIVLMSTESDLSRQGQALSSGADDFLLKPISDAQLVVGMRVRAARARKVAELMSLDSLTGLLKHASIKDRLTQEVDRARRNGKPASIAMVDIDLFKRVNDNWGHPMGDQVIKTLGNLLRQRLRRPDSVGRYGGEEFMVVLPECSESDAIRLLDDIRQRFADIVFRSGEQEFKVTFSAGIAVSTPGCEAHEMLAEADKALYEAKKSGRNQIRKLVVGKGSEHVDPAP